MAKFKTKGCAYCIWHVLGENLSIMPAHYRNHNSDQQHWAGGDIGEARISNLIGFIDDERGPKRVN